MTAAPRAGHAPMGPERAVAVAELIGRRERVDVFLSEADAAWLLDNLDVYDDEMPWPFQQLRRMAEAVAEAATDWQGGKP